MADETNIRARLHEHAGRVAVRIGENKTLYLSTQLAEHLGAALIEAGAQIKHAYHYETTVIEVDS